MKSTSKILIGLAVVAVGIGVVTFLNRLQKTNKELVREVKRTTTPVRIQVVQPATLTETIGYTGTVRGLHDVFLTAEVAGKVLRVLKDLGQQCRRGETLLKLDAESYGIALQDAEAAQKQARVQLEQARRDLKRAEQLKQRSALAEEALERAQTGVAANQAQLARAKAGVKLARRNLRETTVRCPFTGRLAQRMVDPGQMVSQQTPLARLVDTAALKLEIKVSAAELGRLGQGRPVVLFDPTVPEERYSGKVSHLGVAADKITHTFPVEVMVQPESGRPRPGQVLHASIEVASHPGALAVPADAVVTEKGKAWLFLMQGGKASKVEVALGPQIKDRVIVTRGLKAGDVLIVQGQHGLADGAQVERVDAKRKPAPAKPQKAEALPPAAVGKK